MFENNKRLLQLRFQDIQPVKVLLQQFSIPKVHFWDPTLSGEALEKLAGYPGKKTPK